MTWNDLKVFLFGWFAPLLIIATPLYVKLIKVLAENKKLKGDLNLESFESLLAANKSLRDEFKTERDYLRSELEQERSMVKKMANTVVLNASRIDQILQQNRVLVQQLKNILGMKTIVNIKNIKIAVLEDNEDDSFFLRKLLKSHGIENVIFYDNPVSFAESIDSNVRILIVDHKLQGEKNGLDVIREIIDDDEYRYFIMLSGLEDFNVIYGFNQVVQHGVYILKGRPESEDLIIKTIRNQVYYINIISETYNEINSTKIEPV